MKTGSNLRKRSFKEKFLVCISVSEFVFFLNILCYQRCKPDVSKVSLQQ